MIFRTSIKLTILLLALALIFGRLGFWQLQRKAEKQAMFDQFLNAPVMSVEEALDREQLFAKVRAAGAFDANRHILLDNQILDGRVGVHVLTPFRLQDGRTILVNRGWLPLPPDRSTLPRIVTDPRQRSVEGRLNRLPSQGPRVGEADVLDTTGWPQLVTYFDLNPAEKALGSKLEPWQIQLDSDQDGGFAGRQWKAAVMEPKVHGAYAVQWFGLMSAAIVIWAVLGFRRPATAPGNAEGKDL